VTDVIDADARDVYVFVDRMISVSITISNDK